MFFPGVRFEVSRCVSACPTDEVYHCFTKGLEPLNEALNI